VELLGADLFTVLSITESCELLNVMELGAAADLLLKMRRKKMALVAVFVTRMPSSMAVQILRDMLPSDAARILFNLKLAATQASLIDAGLLSGMTWKDIANTLTCVDHHVAATSLQNLDEDDVPHILAMMPSPAAARILEVTDCDAAACILEAMTNDRTLAAVLQEMPTRMARQIAARFEDEQRTAVSWEAMHLELGNASERIGDDYNFAWADIEPWAMSPRSSVDSFDEASFCMSEPRSDDSSQDSESEASSCDGVSAEALGFKRRRPEETPDLLPVGDRSGWKGIRWAQKLGICD